MPTMASQRRDAIVGISVYQQPVQQAAWQEVPGQLLTALPEVPGRQAAQQEVPGRRCQDSRQSGGRCQCTKLPGREVTE
jgi:hypothetical protein